MDDKFLCGMLLGVVGGAILATKSAKTRQLVRDGEAQVMQKIEDMGKSTKKEKRD